MCLNPMTRKITFCGLTKFITHPCGKCLECVHSYQEMWADRLSDEFKQWNHAYFATLTYDNDHLQFVDVCPSDCSSPAGLIYAISRIPQSFCLSRLRSVNSISTEYLKAESLISNLSVRVPVVDKYDVQCFLKRFRVNFERKFNRSLLFKYFLCSEYGPRTLRPHYHIILFSNELEECLKPFFVSSYGLGQVRGFHELVMRHGSISDACAYCAKYCCKPSSYENPYVVYGLIPKPFRLMSKGIGSVARNELYQLSRSYKGKKRGDYYGYNLDFLSWLDHNFSRLKYTSKGVFACKQPRYYSDFCLPQHNYPTNFWNRETKKFEIRFTRRKFCEHPLCVALSNFMEDRYLQLCSTKLDELRMQFPFKTDNEIIRIAEIERQQNLKERYDKRLQSFSKFYGKSFLKTNFT